MTRPCFPRDNEVSVAISFSQCLLDCFKRRFESVLRVHTRERCSLRPVLYHRRLRNVALPLDRECRSTTTINRDTKTSYRETREMRERTSEGQRKRKRKGKRRKRSSTRVAGGKRVEINEGVERAEGGQRESREWKTSDEKNRARKEKRRSSKRLVEGGGGWCRVGGVITGVLRQNGLIVRASWSAAILRRVLGVFCVCQGSIRTFSLSLCLYSSLPPGATFSHSVSLSLSHLFLSLSRSPAPVPREQRHETRNRFIIKHGRARFCGVDCRLQRDQRVREGTQ